MLELSQESDYGDNGQSLARLLEVKDARKLRYVDLLMIFQLTHISPALVVLSVGYPATTISCVVKFVMFL